MAIVEGKWGHVVVTLEFSRFPAKNKVDNTEIFHSLNWKLSEMEKPMNSKYHYKGQFDLKLIW